MKKKIGFTIVIGVIVILGIVGVWILGNRTVATITIDINPSIQLGIGRGEKVKKATAYNEDGKAVISKDLKNQSLENALKTIGNRILEKGYIENDPVVILIHVEGILDKGKAEEFVTNPFREESRAVEVIMIDEITKEDEKLAKKYGISPTKAAYIHMIQKEIPEATIESLLDKPIGELKETKETGRYCEEGYHLEGDFCLKEISREKGTPGKVCPEGSYEHEGRCMEEVPSEEIDNLVCRKDFTMENDKCVKVETRDAEPTKFTCQEGDAKTRAELGLTSVDAGDANYIVCVDYSQATHPVSPCEANDGTESLMAGGVCYWHRAPVIAEGCPGKVQVEGECWDDASNILICPGYRDGKQYSSRDEYCENSIRYIDAVVTEYKCPKDFEQQDNQCMRREEYPPEKERICPSGSHKLEEGRCITDKELERVDGFVCEAENTKVDKDMCVFYEIVEAKHH